ncbi:hypothetical protein QBC35DRAFT_388180 [Podospora australis]|uniref:t-SNARE coiled-coil homology domain-containing protein n=1 Tax=Podospora australis TaxID=1536484 RepID=A0AAN7AHM8_9PEZI|nr:hypothetical protein QBC35DRAFT_388180 [Podospora australis]
MTNPNALLLLADHIKLSLLERQRAKTLNLTSDTQDGHISRSLDQFREGLESLEKEHQRLEEAGDEIKASNLLTTLESLRKQQKDLTAQFHGFPSPSTTSTLTHPNDPSLAEDFAHAQSAPPKKAVRFSSPTIDLESQQSRSALFPYRDDPVDDDSAGYQDRIAADGMTNTQIHAYHRQILEEQDAQLDALGESISRQRELSMQIGDELDEQVIMLDESERAADRHAGALNRARRQVGRIARGAAESGEGRQMGIIVLLIVILVLLIVILK